MHFLENSMFVLNSYFCRESRFVAILRSKLRFLLRNTGVDSDFTQNFWVKNWRLKALLQHSLHMLVECRFRDEFVFKACLPNFILSNSWPINYEDWGDHCACWTKREPDCWCEGSIRLFWQVRFLKNGLVTTTGEVSFRQGCGWRSNHIWTWRFDAVLGKDALRGWCRWDDHPGRR